MGKEQKTNCVGMSCARIRPLYRVPGVGTGTQCADADGPVLTVTRNADFPSNTHVPGMHDSVG